MKQPKNDDRPPVLSKDIIKAQHIVPAKIIKKWKQDGILLTKIKNNPKLQKISNERNKKGLFCVYHRWMQSVEKYKTEIENAFHKLCSKLDSSKNSMFEITENTDTETILNYFYCLMACYYLKDNNSYIQLNIDKEDFENQKPAYTRKEAEEFECKNTYSMIVSGHDGKLNCDISIGIFTNYIQGAMMQYKDKTNTWFYIKTKERLYLPDDWHNWLIISVSPNSILVSKYFINTYLSGIAEINNFDLSQLDINNPPADCKKVISFVKIINEIASRSYDKWIIL